MIQPSIIRRIEVILHESIVYEYIILIMFNRPVKILLILKKKELDQNRERVNEKECEWE